MSMDYGGGLPGQLEQPALNLEDERTAVAALGVRGQRVPPGRWIRENLFNSVPNTILTFVFGAFVAWALFRGLRFVFMSARWEVIEANMTNLMVGLYPRAHLPRVWAALYLIALEVGIGAGAAAAHRTLPPARLDALKRAAPALVGLVAVLSFTRTSTPLVLTLGAFVVAVVGRFIGTKLPHVVVRRLPWAYALTVVGAYVMMRAGGGPGLSQWGGFLLTVSVALGGIALSFPLGVALGLGRRSSFPMVRTFCVGYIELIRGVPLITLLFIGSVTIGLFLPPGTDLPSLVTRGLVVIVLFTGAYLAETVRGGLQSVPRGQTEAATALGLAPIKTTFLIVLPQALRNVIPTLVGQFISLLKDTSLLFIVGLIELLGIAQAIVFQGDFRGQGLQGEVLAFAAFLYWVCCYSMSRASQRLEKRLGVGER